MHSQLRAVFGTAAVVALLGALGGLVGCGGGGDSTASDSDVPDVPGESLEAVDEGGESADEGGAIDRDGDGYYVGEDCDDDDFYVHPDADERCNEVDDDCDGDTDEDDAVDAPIWYRDRDADRYGDAASSRRACEQPAEYVDNDTDCDDAEAVVNPAAEEACGNGTDDDCDGETDEDGAVGSTEWYADGDGDGFGRDDESVLACSLPAGYSAFPGDCDDENVAVLPTAIEQCNLVDDNCDGLTDDGTAEDAVRFYADRDGDTYGSPTDSEMACLLPAGFVENSLDCDDTPGLGEEINPAAADLPDAFDLDANCDGIDGELERSIFVSVTTGSDTNDGRGSRDAFGSLSVHPVQTLARASALATTSAGCGTGASACDVLLATGTYDVGASPFTLTPGMDLYGGYTGSDWRHDGTPADTILTGSSGSAVLRASAVDVDTVVGFLTVRGANVAGGGQESVAVLVTGTPTSNRLVFRFARIEAGHGGRGSDGAAGVPPNETTCLRLAGGNGGPTMGTTSPDSSYDGRPGNGGTVGGTGGPHGTARYSSTGDDLWGGPGSDGGVGQRPPAAAGGEAVTEPDLLLGFFSGSDWSTTAGGQGDDGGQGGGGGGGGAGGAADTSCSSLAVGGAGGLGGAGGCGGGGGAGGGGGGAAIAVALIDSRATFESCSVLLGVGGDGGSGGRGVQGIAGRDGVAGSGGGHQYCPWTDWDQYGGSGGHGGFGGPGGGGAGGAGGSGGPSLGVVLVGEWARVDGLTYPDDYSTAGAAGGGSGTGGAGATDSSGGPASESGEVGTPGTVVRRVTYP